MLVAIDHPARRSLEVLMSRVPRRALILVSALAVVMALPLTASASHSWGPYHWARMTASFTLQLGDNVTSTWDGYLATTSGDWSVSTVLDTTIVAGGSRSPKLCNATTGKVQVCNSKYGNNGWLGLAQIWLSGSHITQGAVKVNDTYFSTASYNTTAWRNLVMCQEVGHTLGLGHNDEDFSTTTGTCMDYSNDPVPNQHPNAHDYAQLESIYGHLDSTTTVAATTTAAPGASGADIADGAWGRLVQVTNNGQGAWFERDLGAGDRILTHVLWAD